VRRRRCDRTALAIGALCALVLAGCSSTHESVRAHGRRTAPTGTATASDGGAATAGAGVSADSGATGSGGGVSGAAGSSGGRTSRSANATASAGGSAAAVPGASCAQVVKIGVSYSSDEGAAFAAVGHPDNATGFTTYAQTLKQGYQIAVDRLNRNGGLAGCKVVLGFHDFSAFAAGGASGESQKECTDFAEDQHVFAVVPGIGGVLENNVLIECLAQHHVPVLWNGINYTPSAADYSKHRGYLYQAAGLTIDRLRPAIPALARADYFGAGAKVGILVADNGTGNNERLVRDLWKPELAAMHIPVSQFSYKQIDGFQQAGGTSSQFASAVLQFKNAGVNHVLFTPDGGDGLTFFTAAAESQGYRPRYALTTGSTPAGMSDATSDHAKGAMAVSWQVDDLLNLNAPPSSFPAVPANSGRTQCNQTYGSFAAAHGSPVASFYPWCDALALLQTVGRAKVVSVAALLSGVESLSTTFEPANAWAPARFGPGHYDGAAAVRVLLWDSKIGQWGLTGPPQPVP